MQTEKYANVNEVLYWLEEQIKEREWDEEFEEQMQKDLNLHKQGSRYHVQSAAGDETYEKSDMIEYFKWRKMLYNQVYSIKASFATLQCNISK